MKQITVYDMLIQFGKKETSHRSVTEIDEIDNSKNEPEISPTEPFKTSST